MTLGAWLFAASFVVSGASVLREWLLVQESRRIREAARQDVERALQRMDQLQAAIVRATGEPHSGIAAEQVQLMRAGGAHG